MDYNKMNLDEMWEVFENEPEEKPEFKLKDIGMVNWAMDKINKNNELYELYKESIKTEISTLKEKLKNEEQKTKNKNSFLLFKIDEYVRQNDVPSKKTTTQETIKLANGTFVRKLEKFTPKSITSDKLNTDTELIAYCKDFYPQYVEQSEIVKWGEIKKDLGIKVATEDIVVDMVNKETGEIEDITIPKGTVFSSKTKTPLDFLGVEISQEELEVKKG